MGYRTTLHINPSLVSLHLHGMYLRRADALQTIIQGLPHLRELHCSTLLFFETQMLHLNACLIEELTIRNCLVAAFNPRYEWSEAPFVWGIMSLLANAPHLRRLDVDVLNATRADDIRTMYMTYGHFPHLTNDHLILHPLQ
jgi:hypothetical protein